MPSRRVDLATDESGSMSRSERLVAEVEEQELRRRLRRDDDRAVLIRLVAVHEVRALRATVAARRWHDRIAVPLTCTVHAPHCAMPQPNFVPFMSRTSRSTQSRGMSAGTSTVVDFPLTLNVIAMSSTLSVWACAKPDPAYEPPEL